MSSSCKVVYPQDTYSVSRASKKWWFRLFYYFLDMAVANSFILYKLSPNHEELTELEYIKSLSLALIQTFSKGDEVQPGPERKSKAPIVPPRLTTANHWPLKTKNRKKCQQCVPSEVLVVEQNGCVKGVTSIYVLKPASRSIIPAIDF